MGIMQKSTFCLRTGRKKKNGQRFKWTLDGEIGVQSLVSALRNEDELIQQAEMQVWELCDGKTEIPPGDF